MRIGLLISGAGDQIKARKQIIKEIKYHHYTNNHGTENECPKNMERSEVEELVNEMDYNFSLPDDYESKVIDTEICDIDEDE